MLKCYECNKKAGKHHIVFKGSKTIIIYMSINEIPLCKSCHHQLHRNKDMDIKYKLLLQNKLRNLFANEYYNLYEIKSILRISSYQLQSLDKAISKHSVTYSQEEIIKYLMGGQLYANCKGKL